MSDQTLRRPARLGGTYEVPGHKSTYHCSLILNAIARGQATVIGLSGGTDVHSTKSSLQAMADKIPSLDDRAAVPVAGRAGQREFGKHLGFLADGKGDQSTTGLRLEASKPMMLPDNTVLGTGAL